MEPTHGTVRQSAEVATKVQRFQANPRTRSKAEVEVEAKTAERPKQSKISPGAEAGVHGKINRRAGVKANVPEAHQRGGGAPAAEATASEREAELDVKLARAKPGPEARGRRPEARAEASGEARAEAKTEARAEEKGAEAGGAKAGTAEVRAEIKAREENQRDGAIVEEGARKVAAKAVVQESAMGVNKAKAAAKAAGRIQDAATVPAKRVPESRSGRA